MGTAENAIPIRIDRANNYRKRRLFYPILHVNPLNRRLAAKKLIPTHSLKGRFLKKTLEAFIILGEDKTKDG